MRAKTRNVYRTVVALLFIVIGVITAVKGVGGIIASIESQNGKIFSQIWSLAFDVVMVVAGFLGLVRIKKQVCVVLSFILFIGFAIAVITGFIANSGVLNVALDALKAAAAWLYIGCVDGNVKK